LLLADVDSGSSSSNSTKSTTPGTDVRTLADGAAVVALQDHTQLTLSKYIATAHPGQPLRFGKLLLLLPTLRTVSASTIEELFFRRTIGNIPIERIICDMYKTSDI
jgi:nuclear receptor subfamily 2 group E protein 1